MLLRIVRQAVAVPVVWFIEQVEDWFGPSYVRCHECRKRLLKPDTFPFLCVNCQVSIFMAEFDEWWTNLEVNV